MVSKQLACIILARGGSKGIKDKNLQEINGQSLVSRCIKTYKKSKYVKEVFVSSDSQQILENARKSLAKLIFREAALSADHSTSESAIVHALSDQRMSEYDHFIFAQCTSPLISTKDINMAVEAYFKNGFDTLFSSSQFKGFVWKEGKNHSCIGINHNEKEIRKRRQDINLQIIENGGFYIIDKKKFLIHKNRFFGKIGNYITSRQLLEIDEYEELEYARFLLRNERKTKRNFKFLFMDFDGVLTDNKVKTYSDGRESVTSSKEDSLGLSYLNSSGFKAFIISSEKNEVVLRRAKKLKIKAFRGIKDKKKFLLEFLRTHKIDKNKVIYVGNDMNDLDIFKTNIFCCCPSDSVDAIKENADFISKKKGGSGAIREICERFFSVSFKKLI